MHTLSGLSPPPMSGGNQVGSGVMLSKEGLVVWELLGGYGGSVLCPKGRKDYLPQLPS